MFALRLATGFCMSMLWPSLLFAMVKWMKHEDKISGTVNIAWSGAAGTITGYEVQYALRAAGSGTWGAWTALKTATGTSTTDTRSMMFGQAVKYRVRAKNGSLASGWKESNALTRTGGVYLRVNGAWKPGTVYRRVNGSWKQAADVYRRIGGTWRRSVP